MRKWGNKSWLKYHIYYCILKDKYFVYPQKGLTTNFTDVGTHNKRNNNGYQCNMYLNYKKNNFKFEKIEDAINVYDSYFENINLDKILKSNKKIESDVYGEKTINNSTSLLLSTKKYNYKSLSSYSLQMYPVEYNLFFDIRGSELFLYDTKYEEKNKQKNNKYNLLKYMYKLDSLSIKDMIIVVGIFSKEILLKMLNRWKK